VIDRSSIIDTRVVYTVFAGKIVYDAKIPRGGARP
jgi:predicted amidohydrolase YtcJ